MSTAIITAGPWLSATRLVELLVDENVGAIPIVDDQHRPMGIVTRADVLEEDDFRSDALELTAAELMRQSPITIEPNTLIADAARIMARQRVHHLLVIDESGVLVGVVSSFDVVRWVADAQLLHLHG
ncbi:MAG: CBS domain-containing protein [Archangiaceae bacterium]|nr:CBS domain-containing protein [Archangiaceae bacterium]